MLFFSRSSSPGREMKCEEGERSPPPLLPPASLLAWSPILLPPWGPAFLPALYPAAFRSAFPGLLDSMKMPGQRPGFQISDILGLNEGKGLEPSPGAGPVELPPYAPPHHYPHELLRHHQPWLSLDHHDNSILGQQASPDSTSRASELSYVGASASSPPAADPRHDQDDHDNEHDLDQDDDDHDHDQINNNSSDPSMFVENLQPLHLTSTFSGNTMNAKKMKIKKTIDLKITDLFFFFKNLYAVRWGRIIVCDKPIGSKAKSSFVQLKSLQTYTILYYYYCLVEDGFHFHTSFIGINLKRTDLFFSFKNLYAVRWGRIIVCDKPIGSKEHKMHKIKQKYFTVNYTQLKTKASDDSEYVIKLIKIRHFFYLLTKKSSRDPPNTSST
ncbi:hypothetical protein MSG28_004688 [Choristoneura fumiferana]|uniref:Uncharacterized protein n=1 Tax=Choristoneura fumiferana TaxID=7141 RepID=A0ACC0K707_CHOFU|nr:hypothetical protein MSG28_004688 [Choristoneura fumiferana]